MIRERFLDKDLDRLSDGFWIYDLKGYSIARLRTIGKCSFELPWHDGREFEGEKSRLSQVAIPSREIFLPNSNNLELAAQMARVLTYQSKITSGLGLSRVEVCIGRAADYVELILQHYFRIGKSLIEGSIYTATLSRAYEDRFGTQNEAVIVGELGVNGLRINHRYRDEGDGDVWVIPLIFPAPGIL